MTYITAVLFDLGDTLVDLGEGRGDYEAHVRVRAGRVYDALTAAGVALEERDAFCVILAHASEAGYRNATARQEGIDIYDVLAAFFAQRGQPLTDELVRVAGDAYCRRSGDHAPLRPGAIETLTALRVAVCAWASSQTRSSRPVTWTMAWSCVVLPGTSRCASIRRRRGRQTAPADLPSRAGCSRRGAGVCGLRGRPAAGRCRGCAGCRHEGHPDRGGPPH